MIVHSCFFHPVTYIVILILPTEKAVLALFFSLNVCQLGGAHMGFCHLESEDHRMLMGDGAEVVEWLCEQAARILC